MNIRTPAELGAAIRTRRLELELDQKALAQKAGVSRKWIIDLEKGSPGAALGLTLRTLRALKMSLGAVSDPLAAKKRPQPGIDLDAIIASARKPRR